MAIDFLKLFHDKRLTTKEPEHLAFIKGHLASLYTEDPSSYKNFSEFYGVEVDVKIVKEPNGTEKRVPDEPIVKVKRGVVQVSKKAKKAKK